MYSGKEAQGQSEIPEGHCIKEVKLFQGYMTNFDTKSCQSFLFYSSCIQIVDN